MPGRILIADDRFASRLMLSALFSGAYYDILQSDRASEVVQIARTERPGAVLLSDGLDAPGAAGLCEALRASDCSDLLRIVITDRDDPARAAMLIASGADEVISRSCSDTEMLARVRRLFDHRARVSDLSMQGVGSLRPHGLAEAAGGFTRPARVAILSRVKSAADWAREIGRQLGGAQVRVIHDIEALPKGLDVLMLDGDDLGAQATVRLTARGMRGDDAPEVLIATSTLSGDVIAQALDIGAGGVVRQPPTNEEVIARIGLLHARRQRLSQLRDSLRVGLQSAMTDPLTGLFNRRYALPRVEAMMAEVAASGRPSALLMCDLDHFKWINDTFGHAAGDAVLQTVARVMRDHLGGMGLAARIGGEEFLIALPACGRVAAARFARELRQAVGELITPYPAAPEGLCVTMSIGVATADASIALPLDPADAAATLMTRADRALYGAKAAGRDCVMQDVHLKGGPRPIARSADRRRTVPGQLAG
ncbi:diguanylate cyclase domain-containing protein [Pseudooceanicola sp. MF1-13]|uniref:diguanylate cyclase domain-containing protein n=1 Tax=Pseudooceanicola sp. MF1-13 TaxID=3379095 RepID=UPI003892A79E